MSDQKQLGNKGGSALQSKKAKSKQKAVLASHYPVRKNFWDSIRPSPGSRKFLAYVAKRDKQLLSSNFLKEIRKNCANLHKPQVIQIIHAIYIPA
jgi:hypothetical protein